jgi:hypothetical protein
VKFEPETPGSQLLMDGSGLKDLREPAITVRDAKKDRATMIPIAGDKAAVVRTKKIIHSDLQ